MSHIEWLIEFVIIFIYQDNFKELYIYTFYIYIFDYLFFIIYIYLYFKINNNEIILKIL
jgi:hypothetical protein